MGETFVFGFSMGFTILDGEDSRDGVTFGVEEVEGLVRDGGVAGLEEGSANSAADLVAFGVDGLDVEGEAGGESVEDGARRDYLDMGADGGEGRAEGDFLGEDVGGSRREVGKGNGGRGGIGAEGERFIAPRAGGSSGDDGRVELNHGWNGG